MKSATAIPAVTIAVVSVITTYAVCMGQVRIALVQCVVVQLFPRARWRLPTSVGAQSVGSWCWSPYADREFDGCGHLLDDSRAEKVTHERNQRISRIWRNGSTPIDDT